MNLRDRDFELKTGLLEIVLSPSVMTSSREQVMLVSTQSILCDQGSSGGRASADTKSSEDKSWHSGELLLSRISLWVTKIASRQKPRAATNL